MASTGTVKAVISGDTIVLMGAARPGGPPPEMQVSLSSVSAPRLGREAVPDEAYAWASREYIRTNALGKAVRFQMDYKGGNRQYATVMMGDDVSLNERVVRAGLATVRKAGGDAASKSREYDTLVEAEAAASAAKAGMHAEGPGGTRSVKWSLTPAEAEELVATNKDVPMKGIIEHVRDGASFSILLALDKKEAKYVKISLALSGVVCPRVNPRGKGKAAPPAAPAAAPPAAAAADADADAPPPPPAAAAANPAEPFALEARHFSETRLLNRELDVCLEGVDSYGNIFGTINHPSGSIGCELLKNGMAKMADWSAPFAKLENRTQLRAAEKSAKASKTRVWREHVAQEIVGIDREFAGTLIEVVSGDQLVVALANGGGEKRVCLASIRAPRLGNPRRGAPGEPFAEEAKELLRSRAIGKPVKVVVDYMRDVPLGPVPAGGDMTGIATDKRPYASVSYGKGSKAKDLGELLVSEGLASVQRHKQGEERASTYDALLGAEAAARTAKKGTHGLGVGGKSSGASARGAVADLSMDKKKAAQHLPFLQRQKELRGVVDFVYTGNRVKVTSSAESCSLMLTLGGVRCPRPGRAAPADGRTAATAQEPHGDACRAFARERLMQRDVTFVVKEMDRNGVFLGDIFVGKGGSAASSGGNSAPKRSFALDLLGAGCATLDKRALERLPAHEASGLEKAQASACDTRKGMWGLPGAADAHAAEAAAVEAAAAPRAVAAVPCTAADIVDGGSLWIHRSGADGKAKLAEVEKAMAALTVGAKSSAPVGASQCRKGAKVAALFAADKQYYRAKILELLGSARDKARVLFLDYGNTATVNVADLRPLDGPAAATAPLAELAALAFLRPASVASDAGHAGARALSAAVMGKAGLVAHVYGTGTGGELLVVLKVGTGGTSVNEDLAKAGHCRVAKTHLRTLAPRVTGGAEAAKGLVDAQVVARKQRLGMWRFGDVPDSDDEEGY